ncbi:hemerythrin [Psychromonas sp. MB-3u-54]|uniref:hemerythrin domain-containing protein n=1 Tax=Psychromonas sp. MB-3u-54 TaxID=2058319 RepID=UPI000C33920D|nr:hemerythrin domain-containing protein [Psychromonas sp. MB-3u-54]PKH02028.1 hemerythrin [Psychromonas sp. MB-3u-54]
MLSTIHKDHVNISNLLRLLREKVKLLENDQGVDYRLMKAIITYLRNYSDKYHHPMEDMIYEYYLKYRIVSDEVANRLALEHKLVKEITIELDQLLDMILLDAVVPKEQCIEKLKNFIKLQMAHMAYEEQEILPKIEASLTEEDWKILGQQWQHEGHIDPLFGDKVADEYKKLSERIKQG